MRTIISILIGITLFTACQKDYYLEDLQAAEAQIAQLQSTVNDFSNQVNDLNNQLAVSLDNNDSLTDELSDANNTITGLNNDVVELNLIIDDLTAQNASNTLEISALNDRIVELEEIIAELTENITVLTSLLSNKETIIAQLQSDLAYAEAHVDTVEVVRIETVVKTVYIPAQAETVAQVQTLQFQLADATTQVEELMMDLEEAQAPEVDIFTVESNGNNHTFNWITDRGTNFHLMISGVRGGTRSNLATTSTTGQTIPIADTWSELRAELTFTNLDGDQQTITINF